ncbi:oxidoreductase [Sinimarinibacterium thermocellulolyticum]|uniref:Oxidoreductase n=1 Tax=Sinimarinibacterium thermocellulolyticum TaxID=3170016 RepID=A0ABV2A6Q6_9GAMM
MKPRWTAADIPPQHGRIALVTGANRGLGFEIAAALAAAGAEVVLGCRDADKAAAAVARIRARHAQAKVATMPLDLASLASVRRFAAAFTKAHPRLDLLLHNAAAILAPRGRTADGFETHLGTNHLGPFALTGLLLDRLAAAPGARVIIAGSLAHRMTRGLDLTDPHGDRRAYDPMDAYGRSKLAALSHAFELDRRLRAAGLPVRSLAAHPGYTATNDDLGGFWLRLTTKLIGQSPALGALPALYAATAGQADGGDYYGPDGFAELRGHPRKVKARPEARDPAFAARLWALSEQLTGVRYLS